MRKRLVQPCALDDVSTIGDWNEENNLYVRQEVFRIEVRIPLSKMMRGRRLMDGRMDGGEHTQRFFFPEMGIQAHRSAQNKDLLSDH